jgi:hypothetical protein
MFRSSVLSSWAGRLSKQTSLVTPFALLVVLLAMSAARGPHLFTADGLAGAIAAASPLIIATVAPSGL